MFINILCYDNSRVFSLKLLENLSNSKIFAETSMNMSLYNIFCNNNSRLFSLELLQNLSNSKISGNFKHSILLRIYQYL